jgi:hypothetical protein
MFYLFRFRATTRPATPIPINARVPGSGTAATLPPALERLDGTPPLQSPGVRLQSGLSASKEVDISNRSTAIIAFIITFPSLGGWQVFCCYRQNIIFILGCRCDLNSGKESDALWQLLMTDLSVILPRLRPHDLCNTPTRVTMEQCIRLRRVANEGPAQGGDWTERGSDNHRCKSSAAWQGDREIARCLQGPF